MTFNLKIVFILSLNLMVTFSKHKNFSTTLYNSNFFIRNHLKIFINDTFRIEILNSFLAAKIFQNIEELNMVIGPDYGFFPNHIPIISFIPKYQIKMTLGAPNCSLEKVAITKLSEAVPICPWHWLITERHDVFPFKRANAKCNCINCQAKTIFDSDSRKLSSCQNEKILMPALFRESIVNHTEQWSFYLEEVPIACICSIRLNPIEKKYFRFV